MKKIIPVTLLRDTQHNATGPLARGGRFSSHIKPNLFV